VEAGGEVSFAMQAFRTVLHDSDMLAYLSMMAPRLKELHRVLKPTGSIYLHCDPTASHYLKILMDSVFSPANFRNEITWKRRVGMSSAVHESNRFGTITDIILFYAKTDDAPFHVQYNHDSPEYQQYVKERFTMVDDDGRLFQPDNLTNPGYRPNLIYEYKGYKPPKNGWAISDRLLGESHKRKPTPAIFPQLRQNEAKHHGNQAEFLRCSC
jgi:adenine specific DNA methylase Mod